MVVLAAGARTAPRPALHGAGLLVLLALTGVLVAGVLLAGQVFYRRRPPVAVQLALYTVLILSSATLVWLKPDGPGFLGGFIATGAAAARLPRRPGLAVAALTLLALAVAGTAGPHHAVVPVVVSEFGAIAFYRVGSYARRLNNRTRQAEELLAELEQTRAAQVRAATLAERQRLAREMHDVLAHSLSGLLIHLEGARLMAVRDGVPARLVDTIERAHHLADAGLGEARLTLYRVAQEALTNIRRHAYPDRVEVRLWYGSGGTRLTVEDFGRTVGAPDPDDHGYGVSGMRERAELLGGTLAAAPTGTGFRVALWVPA